MALEHAELALDGAEKLMQATLFQHAAQALMCASTLWQASTRNRQPGTERAQLFEQRVTSLREQLNAASAFTGGRGVGLDFKPKKDKRS